MNKKKTGGPAFPVACPEMVIDGQSVTETQGMTLRDYFATHSPYSVDNAKDVINLRVTDKTKLLTVQDISNVLAEINYDYADTMIKERNK